MSSSSDHHKTVELYEAFLLLKTTKEVEEFLNDLCTPSELRDLKDRWKVCQLLDTEKFSYRKLKDITNASLTTIGRVARFLREEKNYGYKNILQKLKQKQ